VGWSIALQMDTSLVLDALDQAISLRAPAKGLIVHSDRGTQFASEAYRNRLTQLGILQSMSRKANCYDNAPMESFFRTFKIEDANQQPYESIEQATRAIADYIDRFYNPKRMHSSLGYQSPIDFEKGRLPELTLCT
jgi:transposase InsO family protein